jgi:hypothetical protein
VKERNECESEGLPSRALFKEPRAQMARNMQATTASSRWSWWGPGAVAPGSADPGVGPTPGAPTG